MSAQGDGAPSAHRCWGCGSATDLMAGCGSLCVDCSWEEYLAAIAHTGEFDQPREGTPPCCLASRKATLDE